MGGFLKPSRVDVFEYCFQFIQYFKTFKSNDQNLMNVN